MIGLTQDIDTITAENKNFRKVIYTGKHLQMVVMAIKPGEDIGDEIHEDRDQYFRIVKGRATIMIDGEAHHVPKKTSIIVPAGARHNVINRGEKTLKVYTLYGPPQHRDGVVFLTKAEAEASSEAFDGRTSEKAGAAAPMVGGAHAKQGRRAAAVPTRAPTSARAARAAKARP